MPVCAKHNWMHRPGEPCEKCEEERREERAMSCEPEIKTNEWTLFMHRMAGALEQLQRAANQLSDVYHQFPDTDDRLKEALGEKGVKLYRQCLALSVDEWEVQARDVRHAFMNWAMKQYGVRTGRTPAGKERG